MTVTELLEEIRARYDNADFIELNVEDGRLRVYTYDDTTFELSLAREYEHFSDITVLEYRGDEYNNVH